MSVKHNVVYVRIAYSNELIGRDSVNDEINFVLELNKLLDQHKHLGIHSDNVTPVVTHFRQHDAQDEYGCNINLQFHIRHSNGKLYEYARLHYVLMEIAELCERYKDRFIRMERYLDLSRMVRPWVLLAAPQTVLLREGAAQYNATNFEIPGFANLNTPVDGMVVMGEPRAVRDFTRVWRYKANTYFNSLSVEECNSLDNSGVHHGVNLDIDDLKRSYPNIQWQHLLIFCHHKNVPGNEGWFPVNLDHQDNWVKAGIQYINANAEAMINLDMPYDLMFFSKNLDNRFLHGMDAVGFNTKEAEEPVREAEYVEAVDQAELA